MILSTKDKITSAFLTLLIVVYVGNVSFFVHEHKVGDIVIAHSHPYSNSSHGHTESSIITISWLSQFFSLDIVSHNIEKPFLCLVSVIEARDVDWTEIADFCCASLRAPPFL